MQEAKVKQEPRSPYRAGFIYESLDGKMYEGRDDGSIRRIGKPVSKKAYKKLINKLKKENR